MTNTQIAIGAAVIGAVGLSIGLGIGGTVTVDLSVDAGTVPLFARAKKLGHADKLGSDRPISQALASRWRESKLGQLPDGGLVAYVPHGADDGGDVVLDAFPCVQRPVGVLAILCMRRTSMGIVDFGEENTFPAIEAVGLGCEAVPCSAWETR